MAAVVLLLDRVDEVPGVLNVNRGDLLVPAEPEVRDGRRPVHQSVPAAVVVVKVGVHAMAIVAHDLAAGRAVLEILWRGLEPSRRARAGPLLDPLFRPLVPPGTWPVQHS